jgi:RHS repeat-associated protein
LEEDDGNSALNYPDCGLEDNERGYTNHVHDNDINLTYMQARYYDPIVGRFMGMDPVGVDLNTPAMFNRYAYANNNPYKYKDPNGEFGVTTVIGMVGGFISGAAGAYASGQSNLGVVIAGFSGAVVGGIVGTVNPGAVFSSSSAAGIAAGKAITAAFIVVCLYWVCLWKPYCGMFPTLY